MIAAYDTQSREQLPKLFPRVDTRSRYVDGQAKISAAALMNSSPQDGYLVLAVRMLDLDCDPMVGFNTDKVNRTFLPDGQWKVNFIMNVSYGDAEELHPRNSRLSFEEVYKIL